MCKEQKSTTPDEIEWRDCCSLQGVTSFVIYCSTRTHTGKCCLFVLYNKTQMVLYNKKEGFERFLGHDLFVLYTLCRHLWLQYTHTRKNGIYLLNIYILPNLFSKIIFLFFLNRWSKTSFSRSTYERYFQSRVKVRAILPIYPL